MKIPGRMHSICLLNKNDDPVEAPANEPPSGGGMEGAAICRIVTSSHNNNNTIE